MNIKIITGSVGTGKTKEMFKNFNKNQDNFMITTDASVYYIEKLMAEQHIPGKCIGINSLINFIYQEVGGIEQEIISNEIQIIIISQIMKKYFNKLSTLKIISLNNSLVNDVSNFINNCIYENISSDMLLNTIPEFSNISSLKMKDIIFIYEKFLEVLNEKNIINKAIFSKKVIERIDKNCFYYKNIFIDSMSEYKTIDIEIIKKLTEISDKTIIAFTTTSPKSYMYNIYKNSMESYVILDTFFSSLKGVSIERIQLKSKKDKLTGIEIIEKELFNRDTETISSSDDVFLHEASNIYKEIDFICSKIKEAISQGYSFDDIILTGTDLSYYKNALNNSFNKNNIPFYYYKNKTFNQTKLFDFINNIFNTIMEGYTVDNIENFLNSKFVEFSQEEMNTFELFFLRFGKNIKIALENGKIYDESNFIIVDIMLNKIYSIIDEFKNAVKLDSINNICEIIYNFLKNLNIENKLFKEFKNIESSFPQKANEIVESWNCLVIILEEINLNLSHYLTKFDDFYNIFIKMSQEINLINSQEFCNEVKVLDLKDAQDRKSKICFVIGCNEGKFPFNITEGLISDIELLKINNKLNKKLQTTSDLMVNDYLAIYTTLILPTDKIFISWPKNDLEARPLRYSSILSNVVKTFSENMIQERRYYDNDKEEIFYNLLSELSEYKKTGACSADIDNEYWKLSEDPNLSERLEASIKNAVINKTKINSLNVLDAYKEKEFFAVTRLERFCQCPFKHYIDYAIMPKYYKTFEETAADKGSFYHQVLNTLFTKLISMKIDLNKIKYDDFKNIAEPIISKHVNEHNENILESNINLKVEKNKMIRKIISTAWYNIFQLQEGDFEVLKTEFKIGRDIPLKITLDNGKTFNIIGVIDRIDETNIKNKKYARIIDYKSGSIGFSEDKIKYGLQLQLPLYMKSIIGDYEASGIYYSRIIDGIRDADILNDNLIKKYQLSGITLNDLDVLEANDRILGDIGVSSDVIQADITVKGELSKKSKVLSREEMIELLDKAEEISKQSIQRILDGETTANPLKLKDFNACEYCSYGTICHSKQQ